MSKDDPKLQAFPAWAMGQVLLPVQFQALEQALLSHLAVRAELSGLPAHGVARMHLREGGLQAEGAVAINRLTYYFSAPGPVIDVPGNCVVSDLSVDAYKDAAFDSPLPVYLHVLNETQDGSGHRRYADDDRSLTRTLYRAVLSVSASHDDARESVKLMELDFDSIEGWSLSAYSPPLLRVGGSSSPFLAGALADLLETLRVVKGQVSRDIADDFLSREHTSELRRVRGGATRALARMNDLGVGDTHGREVSVHPYTLYLQLRDFYMDAASDLEQALEEIQDYDHEGLAGCFASLNQRISSLRKTAALNSNALEFRKEVDRYIAEDFPPELPKAAEAYLIIKSGTGEAPELDQFKIASSRRVQDLITYSLPGVTLTRLDDTTAAIFSPKFGRDAICCRLDTSHEEWRLAMKHGDLVVPVRRTLEVLRLYLVWSDLDGGAGTTEER